MSNETSYPQNSPENIASYERDGATGRRRPNQAAHAGVGFGIATGSGGEKPIPHNPEAEEAVIGSLLIDRDTIIKIAPLLRPADFFSEERASVYEAVLELYEQRVPGDLITLRDELRRRGKLGEGEGQVKASYLLDLMRSTATPVHVEHYARIVLRYAIMRRLIGAGAQVTALGFDEKLQTQDMVDQAQQIVLDVIQQGIKRDAVKVGAALEEYFDRLAYLHEHRGELVGIPSGYSDLDKLTGGFQRSDLIILAARPATGKTSLALGIAYNAALKYKRPVGVFSLEMSREQLVQRMLAMETGVDSHRLRTGYIDENEWDRISRAFGKLATAPLYIDDSAGMSIHEVRSKARRLHAEYGIELLIIDYLQLMAGTSNKIENRVQEVSEISRSLKGMARELDIPVICLSQLSRAVENRTSHVPQLSDLRDSGCLAGETLIYLPDSGTYQRIDSLVGQAGFNVSAVNTDNWQIESRQVVKAFSTGIKPVFKMTTRLGRSIRATANHQFLTIDGWKRLDELSLGMRLAAPRQLNGPGISTMSDAELGLLGHLIGDGCTLPTHAIQYTTNDLTLAQTVVDLATSVFGERLKPRINREHQWYQVYLAAAERLTHNVRNPITTWLSELGVFGLRSHEKRVPQVVFQQNARSVAVFLRHLWSTDGCIHLSEGNKHYTNIYYASSSQELARNVQSLLLRLEINARLVCRSQGEKGRPQYHVVVSGKTDIERFLTLVGGLGQNKQAHQAAITALMSEKVANTNRDIVPSQIWRKYAVPAMQVAGLTGREMQAALGVAYNGTALYKQNVSRERAGRVAEVVNSAELKNLATSNVYWDEIISIEPDGETEVYDLTVDGLHNFTANDIIAHNSIEQDSDIVMFIYREELYNPETEKKNIAEIHVAKHRNGPVDVVPLFFHNKTTRFADCEPYRTPGR